MANQLLTVSRRDRTVSNRLRHPATWLASVLVVGLSAVFAPGDETPSASFDEEIVIRQLVGRGAIVKRFEVRETQTVGQLVRFKSGHLTHDGRLAPGLVELLSQIPKVAVEFRGVPLTDAGLQPLATHVALIGLDLSGTSVTDRGVAEASRADGPWPKSLQLLDLSFTRVTDRGLRTVSRWPDLRHVSVIACEVSNAAIDSLSKLPKLRKAYLANTQVTAAAIDAWKRRAPQCQIER